MRSYLSPINNTGQVTDIVPPTTDISYQDRHPAPTSQIITGQITIELWAWVIISQVTPATPATPILIQMLCKVLPVFSLDLFDRIHKRAEVGCTPYIPSFWPYFGPILALF